MGRRRSTRDPLAGTNWSAPGTVRGFAASDPNPVLMRFAEEEAGRGGRRVVDIGCGAGRNAVPLALGPWSVFGVDLSWPMLRAASMRADAAGASERTTWMLAPMETLPVADRSVHLVIAHGIWNLAPSTDVFRRAVAEAARVARPGAGLFEFTFSRATLPSRVAPLPGEEFVFTEFSGRPQVFLTRDQLLGEMARVGFVRDPSVPWTEYNGRPGALPGGGPPVIHEAAFRLGG